MQDKNDVLQWPMFWWKPAAFIAKAPLSQGMRNLTFTSAEKNGPRPITVRILGIYWSHGRRLIQFPSLFNRVAELSAGLWPAALSACGFECKKKHDLNPSFSSYKVEHVNQTKSFAAIEIKSPITGRNEVSSLAFISCRVKSFSHCCQCLVPWHASMGPKMSGSSVYVVDSSLGFVFLQMFFLHGFPLHCHTIGNLRSGRKCNNTK